MGPDTTELTAALDAAIARQRVENRVPSLSAALAVDGEVWWTGTAGGSTPRSRYRVGSITKPMTGVGVLRLVEAGRVGLDDPIGDHLPDSPVPHATIRHLLTHTSGLPSEAGGEWWERVPGITWDQLVARQLPTLFPPGAQYHYSNTGFAILGHLLTVLGGRPWNEVLSTDVWEPLGMTSTSIEPDDHSVRGWAVHPTEDLVLAEPAPRYLVLGSAGEVWSTPSDLVRFGSWLSAHDVTDERVLSRQWRLAMGRPGPVVDKLSGAWVTSQGLALRVSNDTTGRWVGHGGSVPGFQAAVRADQTTGLALAICGNSSHSAGSLLELCRIARAWAADHLPAQPTTAILDPELLGDWWWGTRRYTVRALAADRLVVDGNEDTDRSTLFALVDGRWVGVAGGYFLGEELRLVPDDDAPTTLDIGSFTFTRMVHDPAARIPGGFDEAGWVPFSFED